MTPKTKAPIRRTMAWLEAIVIACVVLLAAAPDPARAGPLVTDGTFSATSLSSPGGYICQDGTGVGNKCTSNLTDWSATCSQSSCLGSSTPGSLLFAGAGGATGYVQFSAFNGNRGLYGSLLNPAGGGNVIAIDGDPTYSSSIFQTVSGLQIGDRYALTFLQAAAQQEGTSGATTEQWKVTFGTSSQTTTLMNNISGGVVGWNSQTLDFIATATSETLTFLAVGSPGGEPPVVLLADVALTDIPEPGSFALLGAGLLAIGALRRRAG